MTTPRLDVPLGALHNHHDKAEAALAKALGRIPLPATTSVDLRRSPHKMGVIDTNAFPAGFNNICPLDRAPLHQAMQDYLRAWQPKGGRIGILAETMTRNPWYAESLAILRDSVQGAGYQATVVAFLDDNRPTTFEGAAGARVPVLPAKRCGDTLCPAGDEPSSFDAILLNNDLSQGLHPSLDGLRQPVSPSPNLGWWRRSKRHHAAVLSQVNEKLARALDVDTWLIDPLHDGATGIDFRGRTGLADLADHVDDLLGRVQAKHDEYGIPDAPVAFVKSDRGTFGMGVLPVQSGKDILAMNSKTRAWMSRGKQGIEVTSVLIQEGIPTVHRRNSHPSEPVLYLVGGRVVGAFVRLHDQKGDAESLNAPGASFAPDCGHQRIKQGDEPFSNDGHMDLYALLARAAAVALALEGRDLQQLGQLETATLFPAFIP